MSPKTLHKTERALVKGNSTRTRWSPNGNCEFAFMVTDQLSQDTTWLFCRWFWARFLRSPTTSALCGGVEVVVVRARKSIYWILKESQAMWKTFLVRFGRSLWYIFTRLRDTWRRLDKEESSRLLIKEWDAVGVDGGQHLRIHVDIVPPTFRPPIRLSFSLGRQWLGDKTLVPRPTLMCVDFTNHQGLELMLGLLVETVKEQTGRI